ncbi:craniofacial development protein 2, partial [Biomphalaria glabrata]
MPLVALELAWLDVDIAALSEVRLANQGSLTERGAGYTLYWSGRGPEEHRQSGVTFMVKQSLAKKLLDYIIVRQCDARDVTHTRVMPSADCYTDHRLVRTKLKITIKL